MACMEMMAFGNLIKHHLLWHQSSIYTENKKKERQDEGGGGGGGGRGKTSLLFVYLFQESADGSPYELWQRRKETRALLFSPYFLFLLLLLL